MVSPLSPGGGLSVLVHAGSDLGRSVPHLAAYATRGELVPLSRDPCWLDIFEVAFGHETYALEAVGGGRPVGYLPLSYVQSWIFGRRLASLPYLNSGGVQADHQRAADALIDRAVRLADELEVKQLE